MSSRFVRGPLVYSNTTVKTTSGNVTCINESQVVVKKDSGAATTVTLPATLMTGQTVIVKDGKGDAATNNITIQPDGVTATTIDGASTYVINANYGAVALTWNGTEWGVQSRASSGTAGLAGASGTSGTGGAGQAVPTTGGAGGAVTTGTGGAGGAITHVAGAGGAASGASGTGGVGGAASLVAGAGGAATDSAATAAGVGGAITLTSGAGGASSTTAVAGGAAGAFSVTGGAGGAGAAAGTGGAGATVAIAGGAGGATSGAGTGGAGGNVTIAGGAGGTTSGGTAGAKGIVTVTGLRQVATTAVAITGATTLVRADSGGIFTVAQSSAYDIDLPSPTVGAGLRFVFQLVSPGAFNVTITVAGSAATFEGTIVNDVTSVLPCTGSTLTFASGVSALGDNIEVISTATGKYFVRAVSSANGGITIA